MFDREGFEHLKDDYLDWLRLERGLSKNTLMAYQRDLDDFLNFESGKQPTDTPDNIRLWLAEREKRKLSARTGSGAW